MRQKIQLYRNKNICLNKQDALKTINELKHMGGVNDGEVVICRYFDNNSEIQTLIGIYSKIDDIVTVSIFQNDNGINLIDLLPKKEDKTNLS